MTSVDVKVLPTGIFLKRGGHELQKELIKRFVCSLCNAILNSPVQAGCGDRYCENCFKSLFSNGCGKAKCNECDEVIENKVFLDRSCKKELSELQKKCGCGDLFSLDDYRVHSKECLHAVIACPNGCGQWLAATDMSKHINECVLRRVKCRYCSTAMLATELKKHYEDCVKFPLNVCPHCDSEFEDQRKATMHIEYLCDKKDYPCYFCEEMSKRAAYLEHVEEKHKFEFTVEALKVAAVMPSIMSRIETLEAERATKLPEMEEKITAANNIAMQLKTEIDKVDQQIAKLKSDLTGQPLQLKIKHGHDEKALDLLDEPERDGQIVNQRSNVSRDDKMHSSALFQPHFDTTGAQRGDEGIDGLQLRLKQLEMASSVHANEITKVCSVLQSQEEAILTQKMVLDEFQLQLEMTKAKTTNGLLTWKIDSLMRRISEADQGKVVSLYSPPFYTSPHGYRMCMRIYLNGDGSGRGTHLSAFFVLMQSEYDDLLPWPFMQKVTIYLLNQHSLNDPSSHVSQSFLPDANSSSFKKPNKEMNIASGFPRFAPRSVYGDKRFSDNDTLYFKVRVNTDNLPQD